jgi:hypothetical protein
MFENVPGVGAGPTPRHIFGETYMSRPHTAFPGIFQTGSETTALRLNP